MLEYTHAVEKGNGILGIDAGGSLCKLVTLDETTPWARTVATDDMSSILEHISRVSPREVVLTGGGAARIGARLAHLPVHCAPEFEAWASGAQILASRSGLKLPESTMLVSLGTGTSVLYVRG